MLTAAEIMDREITSVMPETSLEELGRLFIEKDISGMPVIDSAGKLIGIVTENDLISRNKRLHLPTVLRIFDAFIPLEGFNSMEEEIRKMTATIVSDICTREAATITEDTSLEDIATIMVERNMHHLPVLREGKVVGMVDNHAVIKGIAGEDKDAEP
jgi:CBS domain-containing protein